MLVTFPVPRFHVVACASQAVGRRDVGRYIWGGTGILPVTSAATEGGRYWQRSQRFQSWSMPAANELAVRPASSNRAR